MERRLNREAFSWDWKNESDFCRWRREVQPEKELPGDIQAPMFKDIVSGLKREINRGSVKSKVLWPNHGPKEEQLYRWHFFSLYSLSYLSQKNLRSSFHFSLLISHLSKLCAWAYTPYICTPIYKHMCTFCLVLLSCPTYQVLSW